MLYLMWKSWLTSLRWRCNSPNQSIAVASTNVHFLHCVVFDHFCQWDTISADGPMFLNWIKASLTEIVVPEIPWDTMMLQYFYRTCIWLSSCDWSYCKFVKYFYLKLVKLSASEWELLMVCCHISKLAKSKQFLNLFMSCFNCCLTKPFTNSFAITLIWRDFCWGFFVIEKQNYYFD